MKKNMNENFEITVDEMTEIFGDTPVEMSFREVKEGMDSFFGLMGLTVELVNLIRKEDELKKHHRAYLHVREEIGVAEKSAFGIEGGGVHGKIAGEHVAFDVVVFHGRELFRAHQPYSGLMPRIARRGEAL